MKEAIQAIPQVFEFIVGEIIIVAAQAIIIAAVSAATLCFFASLCCFGHKVHKDNVKRKAEENRQTQDLEAVVSNRSYAPGYQAHLRNTPQNDSTVAQVQQPRASGKVYQI